MKESDSVLNNFEFKGLVDLGEFASDRKPADTGLVFMYQRCWLVGCSAWQCFCHVVQQLLLLSASCC